MGMPRRLRSAIAARTRAGSLIRRPQPTPSGMFCPKRRSTSGGNSMTSPCAVARTCGRCGYAGSPTIRIGAMLESNANRARASTSRAHGARPLIDHSGARLAGRLPRHLDALDDGDHTVQYTLTDLLVTDLHAERALQLEDDLERVDRVEAEPFVEQRHVVLDFRGRDRHPQTPHDRRFHLIQQCPVSIHGGYRYLTSTRRRRR